MNTNAELTVVKLLRTALYLAIATIVYNLAEGLVSVFYGIEDETLALLGF
ncbi:MAG: hypothetical protein JXQ80_03455 [Bacteroidales bacterium]|nr:hypothetical protein [Bacteroidales bacterium]